MNKRRFPFCLGQAPRRRDVVQSASAGFAALSMCLGSSSAAALSLRSIMSGPRPMPIGSDEELAWRFRGIRGGQLVVRAYGNVLPTVVFSFDGANSYEIGRQTGLQGGSISSYGSRGLAVPKLVRMVVHQSDARHRDVYPHDPNQHLRLTGPAVKDVIVECANRYPLELLDAVRAGEGGLRIKIAATSEKPLIAWDLEYTHREGNYVSMIPRVKMAGGDFVDSVVIDGKLISKGWYIDPVTNQKVEAD
jgi:hypothetical protein